MNLRIGDIILNAVRIATVSVLSVLDSSTQTSDHAVPRGLFSGPEVKLALAGPSGPSDAVLADDDAPPDLFSISRSSTNAAPGWFAVSSAPVAKPEGPADLLVTADLIAGRRAISRSLEKYSRWNGEWLVLRKIEERDGFYYRLKDKLFPEPEVIRVRNIGISGSMVNAIKKRNPLCLINPVIFSISF